MEPDLKSGDVVKHPRVRIPPPPKIFLCALSGTWVKYEYINLNHSKRAALDMGQRKYIRKSLTLDLCIKDLAKVEQYITERYKTRLCIV